MGTDLWVTLGELKGFCVVYGITWLFTPVCGRWEQRLSEELYEAKSGCQAP